MARAPEEFPEDVESDRDIRPLTASGSKLPSIFFLIAAVGGILLLLALQLFGRSSDVDELNREKFRPPSTNVRLPEPQAPPPAPAPAPVQPQQVDTGFDPLELERLRQIALLEEQKRQLERERLEALEAERRRRLQSDMLLVDSTTDNRLGEGSVDTMGETFSNEPFSVDGFGTQNEVFSDANERFLRDASNVQVVEATALRLENQETLITQGTFISGVLETAINSDLPGMVRGIVDKNVYGRTGDFVVVPKGSRLIGRYRSGLTNGQARVFIVWSRLERPDGVVVDLGSPGTDALGVAGLGGDVDTHFFSRFGAATLLTTIGPVVSLLFADENQSEQERDVIDGAEQGFSRASEIALEYSINRPPTVRVPQGTKITVFVNRDLSFHDVGLPVQ